MKSLKERNVFEYLWIKVENGIVQIDVEADRDYQWAVLNPLDYKFDSIDCAAVKVVIKKIA